MCTKNNVTLLLNNRQKTVSISRTLLMLAEAADMNVQTVADNYLIRLSCDSDVASDLTDALITEIADPQITQKLDLKHNWNTI